MGEGISSASDAQGTAFRAMSDAVLAIASELEVEPILQKLVHTARELVGARYAALGTPDDEGGFARFLTSGMTPAEITAIGPLPRQHGMLDETLESSRPYRARDLQADPRFQGWPANHPQMRSFLGVPIVSKGSVVGAFYLTDKKGAAEFSEADEALIEHFAAHAAVAIENALFFERSRELNVVEERNRLAREFHDSVNQRLFSLVLTAEAAWTLLERDPEAGRTEVRKLKELARGALGEMRSLIFQLRPADLETEGLVPTLRKHVDVVRRAYPVEVELDVTGEGPSGPEAELAVFRVAQEALHNALRHSGAERVRIGLDLAEGAVRLAVCDDGRGFDPDALPVRARHLGLTSMEERARGVCGSLEIVSRPGEGTRVSLEVPT